MACNFTAHRIAGESKVTLVHPITGLTDPGFGLTRGTSTVELLRDGEPTLSLTEFDLWSPGAIVANLPAAVGSGGGKLRVNIAGTTTCTSEATFSGLLGSVVSDLLFTIAIPELAQATDTVTLVNLLPGFTWQEAKHAPVKLVDNYARAVTVDPSRVRGWGSNRLLVTLPTEEQLLMELPIQTFLFSFGSETQRVPLQIARLPTVDPGLGTVVLPPLARAGGEVELYNPLPGFTFNTQKHGELRIRKAVGGAWTPVEVLTGWDTSRLRVKLPTREQLAGDAEQVAFHLQFAKSAVPMTIAIAFPIFWEIQLKNLRCINTEDFTGADEPRLRIIRDGLPLDVMLEPLNDGENLDVNQAFVFLNTVEIQLYDRDTGVLGDDDDWLGSNSFGRVSQDGGEMRFNRDGADYRMTFALREKALPV